MKIMQTRKWIAGPLIVGLTTVSAIGVLRAQPDAGDMPKGDNPIANQRPRMTPEQRQAAREKRQQEMQARRETNLRETLTEAGFADKVLQDAVIAFTNSQTEERGDNRDKMRELNQAVRKNAGDVEIAALLKEIRDEVQADKDQRAQALKELDAKIGYTKKPRLEAVLTLAGVIGENTGGPGAMGGRGGRGGGMGGGQGGRPNGADGGPGAPLD